MVGVVVGGGDRPTVEMGSTESAVLEVSGDSDVVFNDVVKDTVVKGVRGRPPGLVDA